MMSDIPWSHEATLVRTTGGGEQVEAQGILHQLVGAFLEMQPDQQRGLSLRAAGADWSREYDEATIRELAARPEFTGAEGFMDTAARPADEEAQMDEGQTPLEEGMTGPGLG